MASIAPTAWSQERPSAPGQRAIDYLLGHAMPDGGFAWSNQPRSHLTPTFAAIGCFHLLGQSLPNAANLAAFVRTHHPFRLKKLERDLRVFEYQQIQSLVWLGEDATTLRDQVRQWTEPAVYPAQYEQNRCPVFQNELKAFVCRRLLGLPLDDLAPAFVSYLESRRRANASFNNTPAADGSDGHVMNTWWGLEALDCLGRAQESREAAIEWLRGCQLPSGGFTWQPGAAIGGVDDVAYTWAAVKSLALLGAEPADRDACVGWLGSLFNADGGFSDRAGWDSNPIATYYALATLVALAALDEAPAKGRALPTAKSLPATLKPFTIQIEAHGQGSPAEAVELARSLGIHLWGAKNAAGKWLERAQQIADERKVPVTFFASNEEYGTWVDVPGLGTYSHTSDIIAPAGSDPGPSLAGQGVVSWPEFRTRRLSPLAKAAGRLLWQFGENEELTRILLDDSLERGGFAAISTFHFGNPDFTNSEPFLKRYEQQLPFVALQDAHGKEPWWFADMTTGFRTVFLSEKPTWEGWLKALAENWVVAIRHDAVSRHETWMHGGSPAVVERVQQHAADWQWWDNPSIVRPLASIVAVTPDDEFEAGRPDRGIAIRVRCAWENTTQGQPKRPIAELVKLVVDGRVADPVLVARRRSRGEGLEDHYHALQLPDPTPGRHTVEATVRQVSDRQESTVHVEFTV